MTVAELPMAPPHRVSPDELSQMPNGSTLELVDGEPLEKAVSFDSSQAELWIGTRLTMFTMQHPVAVVCPASMGYRVFQDVFPGDPDRIRKPDASVIRVERVRQLADPNPGYMPIVPDLAVEVVSPNDLWADLVDKVREYHAAGFPLVWIADPGFGTVMVHAAGAEPILLNGGQTITAESALPGFSCRVADLFPPAVPR